MTEEIEGQVPDVEASQEGATEQPEAALAAARSAPEAEDERFDAAYVRKLRAEAAEYRKRLRELERAIKAHEEEKLSEHERMQRRVAELERERYEYELRLREHTLRYETMLRARELGIVDPEAAYRLLDLAEVEYDEDGRPTNLERLLRDLVRKRPYLLGSAGASATNPGRATVSLEEALRSGDLDAINRAFESALRAGERR